MKRHRSLLTLWTQEKGFVVITRTKSEEEKKKKLLGVFVSFSHHWHTTKNKQRGILTCCLHKLLILCLPVLIQSLHAICGLNDLLSVIMFPLQLQCQKIGDKIHNAWSLQNAYWSSAEIHIQESDFDRSGGFLCPCCPVQTVWICSHQCGSKETQPWNTKMVFWTQETVTLADTHLIWLTQPVKATD